MEPHSTKLFLCFKYSGGEILSGSLCFLLLHPRTPQGLGALQPYLLSLKKVLIMKAKTQASGAGSTG